MGNKAIIQANNKDLQRIKKAIDVLPTAKSWGGGQTLLSHQMGIS